MFTANKKIYFLIFLPYKSEMKERFSALSFVRLPEGIRHAQFVPPKVLGVFILASFPKSRISCIGITAISAQDAIAHLIIAEQSSPLFERVLASFSESFFPKAYSAAIFTAASDALSSQP